MMEILYKIVIEIKNFFSKKQAQKRSQIKNIKKAFYALKEFDTYLDFIRPITSQPSPYPVFLSQERLKEFSEKCKNLEEVLNQNAFDCPDEIEKNLMTFKHWIISQEMIIKQDNVSPLKANAVEDIPFQNFRATLRKLIEYLSNTLKTSNKAIQRTLTRR